MKPFKNFIELSGLNQFNWLNPLFLALLPALLIIWLQPVNFSPLIFELSQVNDRNTFWFLDLENHGRNERFTFTNERTEGHAIFMVYNHNKQFTEQYNFEYPKARVRLETEPYIADFNKDSIKEVVVFTQNTDSLFLNIYDYKAEKCLIESRFISTIGGFNKHSDYHIKTVGHYDVNQDSIPEFYFSVSAGFALYPRRVFRYDLANDSLIASINTGAGILGGKILQHNDSLMIAIGSNAYDNIPEDYPYPYHDTATWFFCFDKDLNLKFPPKMYGIHPSGIEFPIERNGNIYYLLGSNNPSNENKLYKMNWQGRITDSLVCDFYIAKSFTTLNLRNKEDFYFYNEGLNKYLYFDIEKFKVNKSSVLNIKEGNIIFYNEDLNNNGSKEILTIDRLSRNFTIYNNRLKKQVEIENELIIRTVSSNFYEHLGYGELILNGDEQAKIYRYYKNPGYYFKYPFWFAIYLITVLFVSTILFFQNKRIQNKQKMEGQLADLQLQNLRNQLDPHFTFNVLNSVGNAIYRQDKEEAYNLFQRFTRMIRSSLMVSDKVFRSLKEEIQFTSDYLEFQKLRFENRFNYTIDVENGIQVKDIKIPKMLLQGFAENAVKHAFYGLKQTGQISIKVQKKGQSFSVIIEDNGIGINQSKKLKVTSGTQKGLGILQEQVQQINRLYQTNFCIKIMDKSESNSGLKGTVVSITFT